MWLATPPAHRFHPTLDALCKTFAIRERDLVTWRGEYGFMHDVIEASADWAALEIPEIIRTARANAVNAKHPLQHSWQLLFLAYAGLGDMVRGLNLGQMGFRAAPERTPLQRPLPPQKPKTPPVPGRKRGRPPGGKSGQDRAD